MSNDFVPFLARKPDVDPPLIEKPEFSVYSGEFGARVQVFTAVDSSLIRKIQKLDVAELDICEPYISANTDLRLLSDLPRLRALSVHSAEPVDWRSLQSLTDLVGLSLRTHNLTPQEIDFTRFPKLERCKLNLHSEWTSILRVKSLRHLMIRETPNLQELVLKELPSLTECFITECRRFKSLAIENAPRFISLGVSGCPSFKTLVPAVLLNRLRYLSLGGKVQFEYRDIARCLELKKLWLNGIGKIPTLMFLRMCAELEELQFLFSTNVLDGDLTFLIELPKLKMARFVERPHYHSKGLAKRFQPGGQN